LDEKREGYDIDFSKRDWFDIKIFPSPSSNLQPLSDTLQRQRYTALLKAGGVKSTKKLHITRGSAIRSIDELPRDLKQRAGNWNKDALSLCYEGIPWAAVRALAGHLDVRGSASYVLPRGEVTPPDSLRKQIFPWLDSWLQRLLSGSDVDDSNSTSYFLKHLDYLRDVLLQDWAVLRKMDPNTKIPCGILCNTNEFREFEALVVEALDTDDIPHNLFMAKFVPELEGHLNNQFEALVTKLSLRDQQLQQTVKGNLELVLRESELSRDVKVCRDDTQQCRQEINTLTQQNQHIIGQLVQDRNLMRRSLANFSRELSALPVIDELMVLDEPSPLDSTGLTSVSLAHSIVSPDSNGNFTLISISNLILINNSVVDDAPPPNDVAPNDVTSYTMDRTISTVRELWKEWDEGFCRGVTRFPAVKSLVENHGFKWMQGDNKSVSNQRRFFNRRRPILDEIQKLIDEGMSKELAVKTVDDMQGKMHLNKLGQILLKKHQETSS
jgi:hypothetical protein